MGSYLTSNHHLAFTTDYKALQVRLNSTNTIVESYGLDTTNHSTSLTVTGGSYVIELAEDFSEYTHGIDLDAGATLSFPQANRMGGIGVVDIRDINAPIHIQYDLECTTFKLKYVNDTPAFWLWFEGSDCYTYTEL